MVPLWCGSLNISCLCFPSFAASSSSATFPLPSSLFFFSDRVHHWDVFLAGYPDGTGSECVTSRCTWGCDNGSDSAVFRDTLHGSSVAAEKDANCPGTCQTWVIHLGESHGSHLNLLKTISGLNQCLAVPLYVVLVISQNKYLWTCLFWKSANAITLCTYFFSNVNYGHKFRGIFTLRLRLTCWLWYTCTCLGNPVLSSNAPRKVPTGHASPAVQKVPNVLYTLLFPVPYGLKVGGVSTALRFLSISFSALAHLSCAKPKVPPSITYCKTHYVVFLALWLFCIFVLWICKHICICKHTHGEWINQNLRTHFCQLRPNSPKARGVLPEAQGGCGARELFLSSPLRRQPEINCHWQLSQAAPPPPPKMRQRVAAITRLGAGIRPKLALATRTCNTLPARGRPASPSEPGARWWADMTGGASGVTGHKDASSASAKRERFLDRFQNPPAGFGGKHDKGHRRHGR